MTLGDRLRRPAGALLGLGLFLAVLGPALPSLHKRFLGIEYVDHYGTQWFYWFTGRALRQGGDLGHTDLFFHPWGKDILGHTGANVLDALVAQPLLWLFGTVLGYNLFVLFGLVAGALSFAWLARHFTRDPVALGLGSTCFALTPYALFELVEGRPTQGLLVLMVLFIERCWVTGRRGGLWPPLAAGMLLALLGYQYWFYALFGGLACLGHGLARAARPPEGAGSAAAILARHALIALVAGLLVAPVAVPLVQATAGASVPGLLDVARWSLWSAPPVTVEGTLVGLFEWQPLRAAHGFQTQDSEGAEAFLVAGSWTPWVLLPLVVLWWLRPGRLDRAVVLAMALCVGVLAPGPMVLLGDLALPNPLYIGLAKALPFFRRLWWPGRAYSVLAVLFGLIGAVGLAAIRERFGWKAQLAAAVGLVLGWWLHLRGESLAPMPSWDATVPAGYRCLAQGPPGALIELPYAWTQAHLYYQVEHQRPILGGMIENNPVFTPPESVALRQDNAFVAGLIELARMDTEEPAPFTEAEKQAAQVLGYRYVVLQRDAFFIPDRPGSMVDTVQRTRLRRVEWSLEQMLGAPVYQDARVAIYAPWGDPSPCAGSPPPPDRELLGRPGVDSSDRVMRGDEGQQFRRLLEPVEAAGGDRPR